MRLPDLYYTPIPLDGAPEPQGPNPLIEFFCGETIQLSQFINYAAGPIDVDKVELKATLKSSAYAPSASWAGSLNNGIFKESSPGYFTVVIPPTVTGNLLPGTYWLELQATEKDGAGSGRYDKLTFIVKYPLLLSYSVSSPNQTRIDQQRPDDTLPNHVDIKTT